MSGTRTRTRVCPECQQEFTYEIGQGRDRIACTPACRVARQLKSRKARVSAMPRCRAPLCTNPATRVGSGLCEACYCYERRNQRLDRVTKPRERKRCRTKAGYIKVWAPNHPLRDKIGTVLEHRKVAYDAVGEGPHPCFWCGVELAGWWEIVIDHENEIRDDNRIENLLVSCLACNATRGLTMHLIRRMRKPAFDRLVEIMRESRGEYPT